MTDAEFSPEFKKATKAVAFCLNGVPLGPADKILDTARRYLWEQAFFMAYSEAMTLELKKSPEAEAIVSTLQGNSLHFINDVLTFVRNLLWMEAAAKTPNSRFSQELDKFLAKDGNHAANENEKPLH